MIACGVCGGVLETVLLGGGTLVALGVAWVRALWGRRGVK